MKTNDRRACNHDRQMTINHPARTKRCPDLIGEDAAG
jgi:hypothetical protein